MIYFGKSHGIIGFGNRFEHSLITSCDLSTHHLPNMFVITQHSCLGGCLLPQMDTTEHLCEYRFALGHYIDNLISRKSREQSVQTSDS